MKDFPRGWKKPRPSKMRIPVPPPGGVHPSKEYDRKSWKEQTRHDVDEELYDYEKGR